MTLALTVGGWGIAMVVAVTLAILLLILGITGGRTPIERKPITHRAAGVNAAIRFMLYIFAAYGIYCWFGGTQ